MAFGGGLGGGGLGWVVRGVVAIDDVLFVVIVDQYDCFLEIKREK